MHSNMLCLTWNVGAHERQRVSGAICSVSGNGRRRLCCNSNDRVCIQTSGPRSAVTLGNVCGELLSDTVCGVRTYFCQLRTSHIHVPGRRIDHLATSEIPFERTDTAKAMDLSSISKGEVMKELFWLAFSVIVLTISFFYIKRHRCPNCRRWFTLRLYRDWHNGGGLGPAGWSQKEWCRHCHTHTSRIKLENGDIHNDTPKQDPHPWWLDV